MIYSYSRLGTFEQCPLKYKFRYIDKIKPPVKDSIESYLGSCVHKTLEWIYTSGKNPSVDEVVSYYSQFWTKNYKKEILIVKKEFQAKDYFNKGLGFLLNYYKKYYPFEDGTLACEKKIIINLQGEEIYKIIGFIDRLVYNSKTKEYEIHDYKTAKNLPSRKEIKENKQLALYSIAIKETHGKETKIVLIWHYLAHELEIQERKTDEELEILKQEIIEEIEKIKSTKEFPPKKTMLCHWCEYKDICPVWNSKEKIMDNLRNKFSGWEKDKQKKL